MSTTLNAQSAAAATKYLMLVLADESYGIAVRQVREIIRLQKITAIPQLPDYVRGVINLRGHVIPVIDLRLKFGLPAAFQDRTCIVVVQVRLPGRAVALGLVVDSVEEVAAITADEIQPPPEFSTAIATEYLLGLAKVKGQVKILFDIDRVVAPDLVQTICPRGE